MKTNTSKANEGNFVQCAHCGKWLNWDEYSNENYVIDVNGNVYCDGYCCEAEGNVYVERYGDFFPEQDTRYCPMYNEYVLVCDCEEEGCNCCKETDDEL